MPAAGDSEQAPQPTDVETQNNEPVKNEKSDENKPARQYGEQTDLYGEKFKEIEN